jgi:hypothetical protein
VGSRERQTEVCVERRNRRTEEEERRRNRKAGVMPLLADSMGKGFVVGDESWLCAYCARMYQKDEYTERLCCV